MIAQRVTGGTDPPCTSWFLFLFSLSFPAPRRADEDAGRRGLSATGGDSGHFPPCARTGQLGTNDGTWVHL